MAVQITKADYNREMEVRKLNPVWRSTHLYFQAPNGLYYKTDTEGNAARGEMLAFNKAIWKAKKNQLSLLDLPNVVE